MFSVKYRLILFFKLGQRIEPGVNEFGRMQSSANCFRSCIHRFNLILWPIPTPDPGMLMLQCCIEESRGVIESRKLWIFVYSVRHLLCGSVRWADLGHARWTGLPQSKEWQKSGVPKMFLLPFKTFKLLKKEPNIWINVLYNKTDRKMTPDIFSIKTWGIRGRARREKQVVGLVFLFPF